MYSRTLRTFLFGGIVGGLVALALTVDGHYNYNIFGRKAAYDIVSDDEKATLYRIGDNTFMYTKDNSGNRQALFHINENGSLVPKNPKEVRILIDFNDPKNVKVE